VLLFPSFVIYLITMDGEVNRLPFDLPEGEGEIVGGYHTEYSSLKFALGQLAEYCNMTTVAALATTLFLGGWRAPWPISVWPGANIGWWPVLWFMIKIGILLFCFIWLRAALPRIRYDQLMALGWKILIPASLAWILMIATIRVWRTHGGSTPVYIVAGCIVAALMGLAWMADAAAEKRRARQEEATAPPPGGGGPGEGAAFPVPPLDLPHYHGVGVVVPAGAARGGDGGSLPGSPADPKEVTGA